MPFYEYQCEDPHHGCQFCIEVFTVMQKMSDDPLLVCPKCGAKITKLISQIGGIITSRMPNQYNDILNAKYWRDHNGVRHKVGPGDGHSNSPTVSRKQTRSPEEVESIKKRDSKIRKKQREADSYRRFVNRVKKGRKR